MWDMKRTKFGLRVVLRPTQDAVEAEILNRMQANDQTLLERVERVGQVLVQKIVRQVEGVVKEFGSMTTAAMKEGKLISRHLGGTSVRSVTFLFRRAVTYHATLLVFIERIPKSPVKNAVRSLRGALIWNDT